MTNFDPTYIALRDDLRKPEYTSDHYINEIADPGKNDAIYAELLAYASAFEDTITSVVALKTVLDLLVMWVINCSVHQYVLAYLSLKRAEKILDDFIKCLTQDII